jgi:peroxiredoxin
MQRSYRKLLMVFLFALLAPAVALWASGCEDGDGEEDTVIDTSPDPQEEDPAAEPDPQEEEQGEEDPVDEPPPDLPLDLPSEVPDGPENCPPPPYGVEIGDIIQPLEFISVDDTMISLCDYYKDTSLKLLLIYATAGWCSVCHYESQTLPTYYNDYHDQGFQILASVFEDAGGNPATRSYAQGYADDYAFPFPTVVDNTFQLGIYFDKAATPMNMFVDLTTMEILDIQLGFDYVSDSMRDDIEFYLSTITR